MITRIGRLEPGSSTRSRSSRVARSAISSTGCRTVVSGRGGALGDAEVVEADDGDVVGHPAPELGEHLQRAGGHQVGGDHEAVEVGVALHAAPGPRPRRWPR